MSSRTTTLSHFHDGIDHATYGNPDLDASGRIIRDRMPVSIDIVGNDIRNVDDNCIEADGAMYNIRILRNRCFNHAHRALSAQPVLGGPAYFIGNLVYHAPEGGSLKMTANSSGIVFYHNTFVGEAHDMGPVSNLHFRNNLVLGQGAFPEIFTVDTFTNYSSSDYNGFRPNPGAARCLRVELAAARAWLADFTKDREARRFAYPEGVCGGHRAGQAQRAGRLQRFRRACRRRIRRIRGASIAPDEFDFALSPKVRRPSMPAWCCPMSMTDSPARPRTWVLMKGAGPCPSYGPRKE